MSQTLGRPEVYGISEISVHILDSFVVVSSLRGHSITTWTRKGGGVSRKSSLGHVTKGRYHEKCPQLSTRGERGQNWVKFGPSIC